MHRMNYQSTKELNQFGKLTGTVQLDSHPKYSIDPHSVTQTLRPGQMTSEFGGDGKKLKSLFSKRNSSTQDQMQMITTNMDKLA